MSRPATRMTPTILAALLGACSAELGGARRDAQPVAPDLVVARDRGAAPAADRGGPAADGPASCVPIPGVAYSASVVVDPAWHDAAADPGANVRLLPHRVAAGQAKQPVHYDGPQDPKAPRLKTIFADDRMPQMREVYQLANWDWSRNAPGEFVSDPPVSMVGFASVAGELVEVPSGGYDIGAGYQVLVLYADAHTITLRYTREDNLRIGYAIYLQGICVEPSLLALYERQAAAGRTELPQLRGDEPLGRATGDELLVAIRDCGTLLDPRGDGFF